MEGIALEISFKARMFQIYYREAMMGIKALYKDKIIRPLEPLKGVREGLIEIEIKPTSGKSSVVARTRGTVKLPLEIAREIAESEEFSYED